MNRLSAAALAATALLLSSGAQASSLLATGDLSLASGSAGTEPSSFDLNVELRTWNTPEPFDTPTEIISLFQVADLESVTPGLTLTLDAGATFDAAVEFLTNGIGYNLGSGPNQWERLYWTAAPGATYIGYEEGVFGLDSFDFAGDTIDSIELVISGININRDYELIANQPEGTGYFYDIDVAMNIYGTSASAAVPIPAAGWLMLSGLGFLAARRRRS